MCFPSFPCGKWYLQSDERLVWATTGQIRVNMKIKEQMRVRSDADTGSQGRSRNR